MKVMAFVVGLERVQLRVRVEHVLYRHHVLKAIRPTDRSVVSGAQGQDLFILVLREERAHRRVGEQDLWEIG
eukprot:evm.model.NODE_6802_length_11891_cov_27.096964.1